MAARADSVSRAGFRVRREPMRMGTSGVARTRARMLELIREGSKDPEVQHEARRAAFLARPHDYHGEIQAVWDYLTGIDSVPYRLDPVDAELLQGASVPSKGRDCDCMVIKGGSLLEAIGHPVSVIIGARMAPPPGLAPRYGHTWLQVYCRSCRAAHQFDPVLDLLRPAERAQLGDVLPHAVKRRFPVSTLGYTEGATRRRRRSRHHPPQGLSGFEGLDGFSFKKLAKGVAKVATSKVGGALIKSAVRFVPGGQAALTAIDVATKGVKIINGLKKGGIGGAINAAAPVLLDRVAPGLSQAVQSTVAKLPAGTLKAASSLAKKVAPKAARTISVAAAAARPVVKRAASPAKALAPKAATPKLLTRITRQAQAVASAAAPAAIAVRTSSPPPPETEEALLSPPEDAEPVQPEEAEATEEVQSEEDQGGEFTEDLDAGPFDDSAEPEEA